QAQAVVDAEGLGHGHCFDAPAAEVGAALEVFVAELVPVGIRIGYGLRGAAGLADESHVFVPVIDELSQLARLFLGLRVYGCAQPGVRLPEAQRFADTSTRTAACNYTVEQDVFALITNEGKQALPLVVGNTQRQRQTDEPKANHVVVEIHGPSVPGV